MEIIMMRAKRKFFGGFLILCAGFSMSAGVYAQTNIFAHDVFNWRFYLNAHADLPSAGLVTEQAAKNHWQNNGISQCRRAHPLFHTSQYLERYPDLQAAFGSNCSAALDHYMINGRNEGREGLNGTGYDNRVTVKNDIIAVGASTRTAGAVDSLYWNGREFINSWDHGRQLQVAWSANGLGECYNPTEAGGAYDGLGSTSSSQWLGFTATGNTLATTSIPAYWLRPSDHPDCTGLQQNPGYMLHKNIQVGFGGIRHIIQFLSQVDVPESLSHLVVEAPTAYLGGEFTSFYSWNPVTCQLAVLSAGPGEQSLPVVLATSDGSAAMGAWSPDLPISGYTNVGYGRFAFPDANNPADATNKSNVVFRMDNVSPRSYHFRSYVAVGSLKNVRVALCQVKDIVS